MGVVCQNYTGHNYIGHNCIPRVCLHMGVVCPHSHTQVLRVPSISASQLRQAVQMLSSITAPQLLADQLLAQCPPSSRMHCCVVLVIGTQMCPLLPSPFLLALRRCSSHGHRGVSAQTRAHDRFMRPVVVKGFGEGDPAVRRSLFSDIFIPAKSRSIFHPRKNCLWCKQFFGLLYLMLAAVFNCASWRAPWV